MSSATATRRRVEVRNVVMGDGSMVTRRTNSLESVAPRSRQSNSKVLSAAITLLTKAYSGGRRRKSRLESEGDADSTFETGDADKLGRLLIQVWGVLSKPDQSDDARVRELRELLEPLFGDKSPDRLESFREAIGHTPRSQTELRRLASLMLSDPLQTPKTSKPAGRRDAMESSGDRGRSRRPFDLPRSQDDLRKLALEMSCGR